jgi:hypothetical protein
MRLQDNISVAPRYARAINLERDAGSVDGLDGYVITTTAQACLQRLALALEEHTTHRAWTLTGPYGSGKSAFALFLASLLGPSSTAAGRTARRMLKEQHQGLAAELFRRSRITPAGFCPILVTGSPEPLTSAVLRSAIRDLAPALGGRRSAVIRELEGLSTAKNVDAPASGKAFIAAMSRAAAALRQSGAAQGIILIVDELGKFLEYAARQPGRGDLYLLQQLAEQTAASARPSLLLFTVLHQAFEHYSADLNPSARDEWAKVQGRFDDVAFQEPPEQILDLVSQAIRQSRTAAVRSLRQQGHADAQRAFDLGLAPRGMKSRDFIATVERCAPLHPLVVLCLARLCRKFGQNQRSLFSFLVSREPHGFASFLLREAADGGRFPTYRLAELYDYVAEAFGSGLGVGESASRWAEVQATLERASAASDAERRWIKTIGLLSAVGTSGELKASPDVLAFAEGLEARSSQRVLKDLLAKSLIVERKHSGTVALWEGSDIDIDARLADAARRLPAAGSLAAKANALWKPRPLVAKRHSYRTGTLRYFEAIFVDVNTFGTLLNGARDADGLLLYALPTNRSERDQLLSLAQSSEARDKLNTVVAIPEDVGSFKEAVRQLELLRWVQANTTELQADAVARRELNARIAITERKVSEELRRLFAPDDPAFAQTQWFHHGLRRSISGGRTLAEFLSGICDAVYSDTPIIRNELANRRNLSSAAAAARRTLIDAMLRSSTAPRLAIEGTPPELSIYASVLANTGIHREEQAGYAFGEPSRDPALRSVWKRIETFFEQCELQRHSVSDLFLVLQQPPFGLKMGVIPIIFCAAVVAHDTEVALYENGGFLPELTIDAFERLLRSPEKFELRRYRIEGVRREVFQQLAEVFGAPMTGSTNLVAVVRPLYKFFNRLPAYSRQTRSLSSAAIAVRDALLAAKEPDRLLFEDLPTACGVPPLPPGAGDAAHLSRFISGFRESMLELQRTYDDLLADLRRQLLRAFNVSEDEGHAVLQARSSLIVDHCVDGPLKAFAAQVAETGANDVAWIEAVATLLVGKTPKVWHDVDRARYEVSLVESVRSFRHVEALVFEETRRINAGYRPEHLFRIGVSDRHSADYEAVVGVDARDADSVAEAVLEIRAGLQRATVDGKRDVALTALAMVCREILANDDQDKTRARPTPAQRTEVKRG